MPFCPVCGYEYEQGIEMCPDCEAELVDRLSEEHFDGDMVEVFCSYSSPEAGMVKELLYNEGIFSATSNEFMSAILGGTLSEASEVRVWVSEDDAGRARDLIETYIEDNPLEEREEYVICSHCGAQVEEGAEFCPYCGEGFES